MSGVKEEYLKINGANEVMKFCQDKEDHLNLFIKRGDNIL